MSDTLVRRGRTGAPVLVVAGSLAADETAWAPQWAAWEATHDVVFVRHAGHGGRPIEQQGAATLEALCAETLAALAAAGIDSFSFVGLSLGALIGLQMAAQQTPGLQRLVACCCRWYQTPELAALWDGRIAGVQQRGMQAVAAPTLERWLTPRFRAEQPAATAAVSSMLLATQPAGYARAAAAVRDADLRGRLPLLGARALVLSGAEDAAAPAPHMGELAAALGCAHTVLPQCAHLPNLEQPAMFGAAVAGWLA